LAERQKKNRKAETVQPGAEHTQGARGGDHAPTIEKSRQFLEQRKVL
jgi:hypothetical protein